MPNTCFSNCCARFLEDPLAAVKVLVPTVAIEVILHKKFWQRSTIRDLTLYLAIVNTYWFATNLNLSFLETPLFIQSPQLTDQQKSDVSRDRFNWLNKIEIAVGVLSLDLFFEWRKRIIDNNGFVDGYLCKAVLIPAAVTAVQAAYLLPTLNKKAKQPRAIDDPTFSKSHRAYIGFETVKIVGLAVAGLRFGKMLTL
ncbi:hypothetical protein INT47_002236 [Mucor saturninus]|uniref:Uncharacterized protein n=1 Tax=Mucor saturninus TaxID=64648 RepID=A0A8H7R650_9FUNG|nr:hypothetical protein INT47_002236 [Mucor saturninus]